MLQGYQSQTRQVKQTAIPQMSELVSQPRMVQDNTLSIAASQMESLENRLSNFQSSMYQNAAEEAADKAKNQALSDSAKGVDFHKKATYTVYGKAYNSTMSATYASDADLKIAEKSNELVTKYKTNPNAYAKEMAEYTKSLATQAPTPELQAVIGISGEKTKTKTFGKLKQFEQQNISAQQVQTFQQEWDLNLGQVVDLISEGNLADSDVLMQKSRLHLQRLVEEGKILPQDAQQLEDESKYQITSRVIRKELDGYIAAGDMEKAKALLDRETLNHREDMTLKQNDNHQSFLLKAYNAGVRQQQAIAKKAQEFSNSIVGGAIERLKSGYGIDNQTEVDNALLGATAAKRYEYQVQSEASKIIKAHSHLSLPEQQNLADSFVMGEDVSELELEVHKTVLANLKQRASKAKADPIALGESEGLYQSTNVISQDSETLMDDLKVRATNSDVNKLEYGEGSYQLLKEQEATALASFLESPDTSIASKVNFFQQVQTAIPDKSRAIFRQLSKKGAYIAAMSASLASEGKLTVAENVLKGQMILKEFGKVEGLEDVKIKLFDTIGNAMKYASAGDRAMLQKSALALYMQKAEENGNLEKGLNNKDTKSVITDLTNGIGEHNDQNFFLPNGVDEGDMEDWIDDLDPKAFENVGGITPADAVEFTQRGQLISVGDGRYRVKFNGHWLADKDNNPFVLEYK